MCVLRSPLRGRGGWGVKGIIAFVLVNGMNWWGRFVGSTICITCGGNQTWQYRIALIPCQADAVASPWLQCEHLLQYSERLGTSQLSQLALFIIPVFPLSRHSGWWSPDIDSILSRYKLVVNMFVNIVNYVPRVYRMSRMFIWSSP